VKNVCVKLLEDQVFSDPVVQRESKTFWRSFANIGKRLRSLSPRRKSQRISGEVDPGTQKRMSQRLSQEMSGEVDLSKQKRMSQRLSQGMSGEVDPSKKKRMSQRMSREIGASRENRRSLGMSGRADPSKEKDKQKSKG
jgi:hypothetical protein